MQSFFKVYLNSGMMSVRHIDEKYNGSFSISTQDKLFQIDIVMPIPEIQKK